MSKLRDTPYFKYLAEVLYKTDVDSEQWDAINGAMHQMEDQEAEVERLRKLIPLIYEHGKAEGYHCGDWKWTDDDTNKVLSGEHELFDDIVQELNELDTEQEAKP